VEIEYPATLCRAAAPPDNEPSCSDGWRTAGLAAALGGTAHPADLSDPTQVATLVNQVEDEAGPIDVLVNNAGVGNPADFVNAPSEHLRHITEVNYLAPAELCRQVIPRMLGRGGGHIVNVSSVADCAVFPGLVAYCSSKAALSQFTAGLRADLRGLPIGTTLVELGPIPTDMLAEIDSYEPTAASFQRFYRTRLIVDVPREKVADQVVEAVQKGRRHVRIPKRTALFPLLSEAPRRTAEVLLTGVPHRESTSYRTAMTFIEG
jgi:NAD(P)-dependent dehydrogenase (short-subunit alcohol dehydrogenase family)